MTNDEPRSARGNPLFYGVGPGGGMGWGRRVAWCVALRLERQKRQEPFGERAGEGGGVELVGGGGGAQGIAVGEAERLRGGDGSWSGSKSRSRSRVRAWPAHLR